ncbi:hypothetical protein Pfo_002333 [Paulownia fortunei]|nr:hypothetical protein Pfo_002333 [Paulownia fortunei]
MYVCECMIKIHTPPDIILSFIITGGGTNFDGLTPLISHPPLPSNSLFQFIIPNFTNIKIQLSSILRFTISSPNLLASNLSENSSDPLLRTTIIQQPTFHLNHTQFVNSNFTINQIQINSILRFTITNLKTLIRIIPNEHS